MTAASALTVSPPAGATPAERSRPRARGGPAPRSIPPRGEPAEGSAPPPEPSHHSHRGTRQGPVEGRTPGKEPPHREPEARRAAAETALEPARAELSQHRRERDAHGADLLATSVEGAGVRQVVSPVEPHDERGQHRAHRPGVHPAVGVAADRVVHGTVVEARAAADAAQHLAELAREHRGPAVVDQHHVELLRAVEVLAPARPGRDGGVDRHLLPGGAPREEPQDGREVLEPRQDLLDSGDDDVHAGQGVAQVTVAFVGHDHRRSRLRDEEVRPGDPDVGAQEVAPQHLARPRDELRVPEAGRPEAERRVVLGEEIPDLLAGLVDGGGRRCGSASRPRAG